MKRWIVLGILALVGAVSLTATTYTQDERVVEVEQLEDNLYVLRGGGGNSAAFITENGVVLVDTKLAGWGQPLIDAIAELTSNPVTTIINTHSHFDHVSGSVEFPATVDIVAHENAARLMGEWNGVTGLGDPPANVFEGSGGQGMPTETYSSMMYFGGDGADRVELYYFGRGHTGGDTWVVFPALRVMHAGDMFPAKMVPIMDANNGGSGVDYAETLWNGYAAASDIDRIITGHSSVMTPDDLREYAAFVGDFETSVRAARRDGRSVDDFASTWQVPPRYTGYARPPAARLRAYTQVIYDEIAAEAGS